MTGRAVVLAAVVAAAACDSGGPVLVARLEPPAIPATFTRAPVPAMPCPAGWPCPPWPTLSTTFPGALLHAQWTLHLREAAGVGGTLDFVRAEVLEDQEGIIRAETLDFRPLLPPPYGLPPEGQASIRQVLVFSPRTARPRLTLVVTPHFTAHDGRVSADPVEAELRLPQ